MLLFPSEQRNGHKSSCRETKLLMCPSVGDRFQKRMELAGAHAAYYEDIFLGFECRVKGKSQKNLYLYSSLMSGKVKQM